MKLNASAFGRFGLYCRQPAGVDNIRLRLPSVNEYHEDSTPAEFITIVEGPTPDFTASTAEWPLSLQEGPSDSVCAVCKLRSLDGRALMERCQTAWNENRPVRLDYPDGEGGRQEAEIVAARMETVEEGDVLYLWVCL